MPSVKEPISIATAFALGASGGPTFTPYASNTIAYGGIWLVTITNSSNKFSKGVQVQAQISNAQGADAWDFDCRHVASDRADAVSRFAVRIPAEVNYTRLRVQHGDEAAVLDAVFLRLTQV